jgi:mannose-1-phosphate guanylyltransferase
MNNNYYCVIMAGGVGSRFWPLSRSVKPKQFLGYSGNRKNIAAPDFRKIYKNNPNREYFSCHQFDLWYNGERADTRDG